MAANLKLVANYCMEDAKQARLNSDARFQAFIALLAQLQVRVPATSDILESLTAVALEELSESLLLRHRCKHQAVQLWVLLDCRMRM